VCNINQTYTLTEPAAIGISTTRQNVTTCGGTNGSINITATNGTGSEYVYTWTGPNTGNSGPGFGGNFNINNLPAGNYIINVTNGGCTNTTTVSISESGAPNVNITVFDPISCNGAADGIIKVNSTSNINAYTFTWSTGATGTTVSNLAAGTYTVTVTGTNGTCTTTANFVLTEPDPIQIDGSSATSQVNVTISGGTAPYTTSWSGPSGYTSSQEDISNLTVLGNYTLNVTDANGCTESRTFNVQFLSTPEVELASKVLVYPNPVSDVVTIETPIALNNLVILNAQGQVVSNLKLTKTETTLNVSSLSNGMYYLEFTGDDNQKVIKKLSVTH
jgi:hypothetical protein